MVLTTLGTSPGLQFADLDGDEDLEIITHSGGTAYLENLGGLQFEAAREIEIGDPFATATEIRIADMDGDERSDVVFIPSGEDRLRVITNEIESGRQVFSDVDIDNVHAAIREESSDPALDWNNDGAVDVGDVDLLLEEMGNIRGDADLDGEVGFRDFLIVQESYGMSEVGWARGDFDGNGEVDFADFLYVRENFGHPNL